MNGHAGIDTLEATEHLKNILNVGRTEAESGKLKPISNGNMESSGDSNLVLSNRPYQKIELCADKDSCDNSVYGHEVDIYSSPMLYNAACSQIIVEDMVDFGWEEKYYYGRLISFHISGKYLAYLLKPNNKPGFVRILRIRTDRRCLIKDYEHEVKDIAFAHSLSQVLLGSIDACGEFLVHKITDLEDSMTCNVLIHIRRPASWVPSDHNHIIWCLYIPDENEDDTVELEKTSLLVTTHDEKVEIWNIHNVIEVHGPGTITFDEATVGVQPITEFEKPITHATFAPDGSALAIGSLDGVVKFFQVNNLEKNVSPRCLHHWTPHGEKMLSSLYFLDNHKNYRPDVQFWKFAVTGADNNTELKVWSCETWVCLQTLRIHPNVDDCIEPCFKAEMDLTSRYMFLSDIKRKVLLILLVQQDPISSAAFIKSISEFRVPLPVLSLAISSVSFTKFSSVSGEENSDEEEEIEQIGDCIMENDDGRNKLIVKLFWIQTKTLQSCHIMYNPKLESPLHSVGSISSLSQDSYGFKDGLSDISLDAKESTNRATRDIEISLQKGLCMEKLAVSSQSSASNLTSLTSHINYSKCTEVLLTPDDFTSPSHSNLSSQSSYAHLEDTKNNVSKCDSATRLSEGIDSLPVEPSTLQRRKSSQHSATSSPSREVAEIMAPTKGLHMDEVVLETPNLKVEDDVEEALSNSINSFAITTTPISTRNQPDYHMKEWPQAPDPSKELKISNRSENDLNSHNKCFLSKSETTPATQFDTETNRILYQLNQKFDEMLTRIEALADISNSNRRDIQNLQNEIKSLQDQKHNQFSTNLSKKLDQVVSQQLVSGYSRIENLILKSTEDDQRRIDRELAAISSDLSSSFGNRLDSTLKQELASSILPQINRVLDTVAQKMQLDFSQTIETTDANLKETFHKQLKGKAFVESFAQNMALSLQGIVHSACKEVFQSSVIPAYEKSCQHLFHQLNEQFQKGTSDYIQILEKNGLSSCTLLESTASQLKEEINNFLTSTQQEIHNLSASAQQAIHNHSTQVESRNLEFIKQREALFTSIRQIIHEEVRKALKNQTSVLNSRSQTPVPHNDPMLQKQLLLQLVKQGNIDDAFQQALSAMDVQLVIFLCESVSVDQVFGVSPCPLQQHVLLSLVNQLSADLAVKTDIKIRYIEDVIACLDGNDPIIKEHIRNVLENLQQRIIVFLQKNPNHKYTRNLKRISLAIQSLINC